LGLGNIAEGTTRGCASRLLAEALFFQPVSFECDVRFEFGIKIALFPPVPEHGITSQRLGIRECV
jgi:hypothetical protein